MVVGSANQKEDTLVPPTFSGCKTTGAVAEREGVEDRQYRKLDIKKGPSMSQPLLMRRGRQSLRESRKQRQISST
ncbi:unnamed protein product [Ilex paraguariensis]|uniref:Uncharacterized protein n=1 Tax=Ilex paraguariensis TaxID=185542 RepID=A0ABC8S2E0_9AQUA